MTASIAEVAIRLTSKQPKQELKGLAQQSQKTEKAVESLNGRMRDANGRFVKSGAAAKKAGIGTRFIGVSAKGAVPGVAALGVALKAALGPIAAITSAAGALTALFGTLSKQDFAEAKFRSLGGSSEELKGRLQDVSRELSGQASVVELTGAAYDVASAGFSNAADAAEILKAASLGATGGFSDINTVGDAATSVLNAYGLEADKAAKLVDGFIQTQNDGKIVIGEYAANIAKVAPIASALGVPLEEVNAAVAQITGGGEKAEVTFTSLKNAFAQIAGGKVGKEFEKFGVEINAATLKSDGLAGTLEKIKSTGADTGEIIKAFGIEGGQAIITLLGNTEKYNQLLENQKQSQGAAAKAAFTASDTIDGQLKRLTTAFQNLFSDQSELGIIIKQTFKVAAVTVEALGVALNVLLAPGRAIMAAFKEIGGAIAEAIGLDATDAAFNLEQGFQNIVKGVNKAIKIFVGFGKIVGKIIGGLIAINIKLQQEVIVAYQKFAERVIGFFTRIFDTGRQKFTELKDNIVGTVTGFIDTGIQKFGEFRDFITAALTSPVDKASSVFSGFAKFMQGILQRIGSFASGFFTGFTNSAQETATRVTKFFGGLFEGLTGIINNFISILPDWLKNALGGVGDLAGGIAEAIGNALRGIKDLAAEVPGQITALFGPDTSGGNQQGQAAANANDINKTGGLLGKGKKTKADIDKEAEQAKKIAEESAKRVQALEDQTLLASALTAEERTQFERQIQIRKLVESKNNLTKDQLNAELAATLALHDQVDATNLLIKAEEDRAKAAKEAQKAEKAAAQNLSDLYTSIGDSIKTGVVDALSAAVDGTKSLAEVASSVLRNIANILLKFGINQAFSALGAGGGFLGKLFGGKRAKGGPVSPNRSFLVGERGPELFVPGSSGNIVPNHAMGGTTNVVVNVDAKGTAAQGDDGRSDQLGRLIGAAVQAELIKQKRPGGLLTR